MKIDIEMCNLCALYTSEPMACKTQLQYLSMERVQKEGNFFSCPQICVFYTQMYDWNIYVCLIKQNQLMSQYILVQSIISCNINKYTWAPQTVHNTPVMKILKGFFYIILF